MNEDVKSTGVHIHSRADELIACLEGEIAKRDEELAACRVAVENCELFRARIAELEGALSWHEEQRNDMAELRAELAAIKAQEQVDVCRDGYGTIDWYRVASGGTKLYAAPVSEAKAQGVVMPERKTKADYGVYVDEFADEAAAIYNAALDEVARLNAAPAAPAADAGLVLEQAMYTLISIGYHENSGLVHELRQALAARRAKGVV